MMKKNKIVWFLISCLTSMVVFQACSGGGEKVTQAATDETTAKVGTLSKSNTNENLNISILLDLSDRIDPKKYSNPSMEFYKRDLGYIASISSAFEMHLRSKPLRKINDQIQVYFEPEPLDASINSLAGELRMAFTKENATKDAIQSISPRFVSISEKIYGQAIADGQYFGADIWGFFKSKVKDYCIKPDHRNILFILTDGYMFHEDSKFMEGNKSSYLTPQLVRALKLNTSKYMELIQTKEHGFVKATDGLSDLEVVVLGVNPAKGSPFEGDVINEYWTSWLQDMKVKEPITAPISADLPSNLDQIIQRYINR